MKARWVGNDWTEEWGLVHTFSSISGMTAQAVIVDKPTYHIRNNIVEKASLSRYCIVPHRCRCTTSATAMSHNATKHKTTASSAPPAL